MSTSVSDNPEEHRYEIHVDGQMAEIQRLPAAP
jgi:hypothetical protein